MPKKTSNITMTIAMSIISVTLIVYILQIGASLLIPFVIALLFSFAIMGLTNFYKRYKVPSVVSFILSIATYFIIFWLAWQAINSNINDVIRLLPEYQDKIYAIVISLFEYFNVTPPTSLDQVVQSINLQSTFTLVFSSLTGIFSNMGLIIFYVIFILLEYRHFWVKLRMMVRDKSHRLEVSKVIEKIGQDVKSYFVIKAGISFVLGILSYLVMVILGLDFAVFWAFIIFILNFIPFIGSIVAVTFPILLSLVQFDSYYISIAMATGLIAAQTFMGNIVEPKFVGNRLNLSPLVIIIALGFWWKLWWVVGMLLSVPIIVILNIILAKIPATRSIAVLLSEKWELEIDPEDEVKATRKQLLDNVKQRLKLQKIKRK